MKIEIDDCKVGDRVKLTDDAYHGVIIKVKKYGEHYGGGLPHIVVKTPRTEVKVFMLGLIKIYTPFGDVIKDLNKI